MTVFFKDDKVVVGQDWNSQNWTLGDVRRVPVREQEYYIRFQDLPKLSNIDMMLGDVYPSSRNRSRSASDVFVYNRVPKCASTTVRNVIAVQSKRLGFNVSGSRVYWSPINSVPDEMKLVDRLKKAEGPLYFDKHTYFVDTTK
jgi:hypothetical protein